MDGSVDVLARKLEHSAMAFPELQNEKPSTLVLVFYTLVSEWNRDTSTGGEFLLY